MARVLSPAMTVRDFENSYWYLDQLKDFAERIGIPAAKKLRKDELERAIVVFLRTGTAASPTKRSLHKTGVKDVERGLDLRLRIEHYTSDRETKDFIIEQARAMAPDVREKSGVWYRLNRWREEQLTGGKHPTYGDLVRQYVALNSLTRFERVPHGRYINFVADFLRADKKATRADAIAAWNELKTLDAPKDYASWVKARATGKRSRRRDDMMKTDTARDIRPLLTGGDRRSIARSDRARALIERDPSLVIELVALTADEDWLVAQRALDLLEKLAHDHPDWIEPHKAVFIGPLASSDKWEIRLQIVRAVPLFRWSRTEERRVENILIENVSFPQTFVRAWALDGLAALAERRAALLPIVRKQLRAFERSPSKALHARARQIRARLGSA